MTNKPKAIGTAARCWICQEAVKLRDGRSWRRRYCSTACKNTAERNRYQPKEKKPRASLAERHRAAWEVTHWPIPDGLFVLHRCDNPPCCDPEHLFLGTDADNTADKVAKGRQARGLALPHTKLSDAQVAEIRRRYDPRYGPPKRGGRRSNARELGEEYGISSSYVMQVVHGHFRKDA